MVRDLGDRLYAAAGVGVEHRDENVAGVRTHWVEAGPPGGRAVLLVHGAGGAAALWASVLPVLVEAGCRVVAPDVPGHGESEIPGWTAATVPARLLAWTEAMADRVGAPIYIGHSYGGYLGLLAWERRPGRFPALVLIASAGLTPGRSRWMELAALPLVGELLLGRRASRATLERMARRMAPRADDIPNGQLTLDYMHAVSGRRGFGRFRLALVRGTNIVTRDPAWQTAERVDRVTCPALLAWGPRDYLPIADGRRAAAVMPHARLIELEGTGHLCYLESAEAFNAALREFVSSLS